MENKNINDWNPELFATYWINYSSRLVQNRFENSLRPLGFSLAYVGVATELDKSGQLLQRDLAKRYGVEQPTMASLLVRMERDGLVLRRPHPEDKRASLVSLTAKGKAKLPGVKQKLIKEASEVTEGLTHAETKTLMSLLRKVSKNLVEPVALEANSNS